MDDAISGSPLRPLDENLWVVDRPLRTLGLHIGTRMTVIRLRDGSLFLHSPVGLDTKLLEGLQALGPVRFLIAPNRHHYFFIGQYPEFWPDAELHAAPGLAEKCRDVAFHAVLGNDPAPGWAGEIEQVLFEGADFVSEVAFYHRGSRSLLLTDLAFNAVRTDHLPTRLWYRLNGCYGRFGAMRFLRLAIRDREAARRSLDRMLAWDFERVIVTHGAVLPTHGKRLLREAYVWL